MSIQELTEYLSIMYIVYGFVICVVVWFIFVMICLVLWTHYTFLHEYKFTKSA